MQIPDLLGITKSEFYKKIEVSSSNYNGKSRYSEITADVLLKISIVYSEISIEWLVTGNGPMLKSEVVGSTDQSQIQKPLSYNNVDYKEKYYELLEENRELRIKMERIEDKHNIELEKLKETHQKHVQEIEKCKKELEKFRKEKNNTTMLPV